VQPHVVAARRETTEQGDFDVIFGMGGVIWSAAICQQGDRFRKRWQEIPLDSDSR
jgi:hypothetical protein